MNLTFWHVQTGVSLEQSLQASRTYPEGVQAVVGGRRPGDERGSLSRVILFIILIRAPPGFDSTALVPS